MRKLKLIVLFIFLGITVNCTKENEEVPAVVKKSWKFAVVGDTHVTNNSDTIKEMIPYFIQDSIQLILVCGDIVEGGKATTSAQLEAELVMWQNIFAPLYANGIGVYPIRGNHEDDAMDDIAAWNNVFNGIKALPQNGPVGEVNLTYSFTHKNALFIGLDNYVNIHKVNQPWLDLQLASNKSPHVFVFGHEAAFKVFHSDCLDDFETERNIFWNSLSEAGVRTYFCGHDHFFDAARIDNGDGNTDNDIYQCLIGGGGGWLMSKYNYNGINSGYTPIAQHHKMEHGYLLIEVSGDEDTDLDITITWKERYVNATNLSVSYPSTDKIIKYTAFAK